MPAESADGEATVGRILCGVRMSLSPAKEKITAIGL
jgi:hypothetical protein